MKQEGIGKMDEAARLFDLAWTQSANDFERCIAAHYVARHQASAELTLQWNQQALDCANRTTDGSTSQFLPSLYLNLGKSHEDLGNTAEARRLYERAAVNLTSLSAGAYRDIVQDGIIRGLQRVANSTESV
jgi:tetratricopeptide (TPR) repeat protein